MPVSMRVCKGQFGSGLFLGEVTFAWKEDRKSLRQPGAELPGNVHTHTYACAHTNTRIEAYTVHPSHPQNHTLTHIHIQIHILAKGDCSD